MRYAKVKRAVFRIKMKDDTTRKKDKKKEPGTSTFLVRKVQSSVSRSCPVKKWAIGNTSEKYFTLWPKK